MTQQLTRAACAFLLLAGAAAAQTKTDTVRSLNNDVLRLNGNMRRSVAGSRAALRSQATAVFAQRQKELAELIQSNPAEALQMAFSEDLLAELAGQFPGAALESRSKWRGPVEAIVEDGVNGDSREIYRLHAGGEVMELHFAGTTPGFKCDDLVEATGMKAGGRVAVESVNVTASATATCSPIGVQRIAVIIVNFPSASVHASMTPELLKGIFLGNAFSSSQSTPDWSIDDFWKKNSNNQTSVASTGTGAFKVAGPYLLAQDHNFCSDTTSLRAAAYAAADADLNYADYNRVVIIVPNYNCSGTAGVATLGCWSSECPGDGICGTAWSWWRSDQAASRSTGVRLGTHELGHTLNLGHANSRGFTGTALGSPGTAGTVSEYGDLFSTMGNWNMGSYSARHAVNQLGWLPGAGYQTVTTNGTFSLLGYDQTSGLRALKVKRGTENAYLWLQYYPNNAIYLNQLSSQIHNGAYITFEDSLTPSNKTQVLDFTPTTTSFSDPALVGTWTDPYSNLTINVGTPSGSSLPVTITYGAVPCTAANPTVSFSPTSRSTSEGVATSYAVSVKNNDSATCASRTFSLATGLSPVNASVVTSFTLSSLTLAPGVVGSSTLNVTPASGTVGSYTVSATATQGVNSGSASAGLAVTVPVVLPNAPSGLTATPVNNSRNRLQYVRLNWADNSNNETSFRIERCTGSTCTFSGTALTTTAANVVTYNNTSVSKGTTYKYRVRSQNASGNSAWIEVTVTP